MFPCTLLTQLRKRSSSLLSYAFFPSDEKEAKYARYCLDRGESKAKVEPVSTFFLQELSFFASSHNLFSTFSTIPDGETVGGQPEWQSSAIGECKLPHQPKRFSDPTPCKSNQCLTALRTVRIIWGWFSTTMSRKLRIQHSPLSPGPGHWRWRVGMKPGGTCLCSWLHNLSSSFLWLRH